MLDQNLLRDLAGHDASLCLSLYLEVAAGGGEHDHVRIALKKAKSEAAAKLGAASSDDAAFASVRDRLDALDYEDLVGGHDRRVAIFIAPGMTEVVDARFDELGVHLGTRFRLSPLLGDLERIPDHAVLVASQEEAHLYTASAGTFARQKVEDMPASLSEISRFTDQQEKGNIHGREDSGLPGTYRGAQATSGGASGPEGVPHHSMGGHDWREDKEEDLRQYANLLVNAVGHHLSGTNLPLVIVADERLNGMIRENCEYPFLAPEGVLVHPRELEEDGIRERAARCLRGDIDAARAEAWDKVAMSLGRDDHEASTDPSDVATAAAAGRVAHLFVRAGASVPGRIDETTFAAEQDESGPEDLVDRAISDTMRNGGAVFSLGDYGGEDIVTAAAYRYPA
ncbi:baeRF3 domain-containing protein [Jannaschia formosa]|uniref:baeRF3 domain-containing protein n=1 Tax=Jannaschia formosa TaxID=2259592 RepID=UPI000E1BFA8F|nr:hypothetical protein [Jannaschia formosa]TFL16857.1 hypothetical protein DR046_17775 [Jannaschia formosa]